MLEFVLPAAHHRADVQSFYAEIEADGGRCIGCSGWQDYDRWLTGMQNRCAGKNLPDGYVRENFYLCYDGGTLVGVFSLKFELTDFLRNFGGHIGYAVRPSLRCRGIASEMLRKGVAIAAEFGFDRVLCVCDADNIASEKVIQKNGGVLEDERYDPDECGWVRRYWITVC